jgi:hypothetical protein
VAQAGAAGGAPDVPLGHVDQSWVARLDAARSKEARLIEVTNKIKELRDQAATKHPEAVTQVEGEPAPSLKMALLPDEVRDPIRHEEETYAVVRGQLIAVMWCANLRPVQDNSPVTCVGDALKLAGLEASEAPPA